MNDIKKLKDSTNKKLLEKISNFVKNNELFLPNVIVIDDLRKRLIKQLNIVKIT